MSNLKLSKNLLQMKFMQRTKEKIEIEEEKKTNSFNQNFTNLNKKQKYFFEPSFTFVENLKFGRVSYKGMNGEIEKLMDDLREDKNVKDKNKKEEKTDDEVEITEEEMASRYVQLNLKEINSLNKKKRKRN